MTVIMIDRLFNQVATMEVNLHVYALSVVVKSQSVNLDLEKWAMARLEISHGVKIVDNNKNNTAFYLVLFFNTKSMQDKMLLE